jgi:hypothetical protein
MHPHVADAFRLLDDSRAALLAAIDALPPPQRTERPGPGRWSAVDVLEHLSLVESRFCSLLAARIDEALQSGLPAESGSRAPLSEDVGRRLLDRANKRSAPDTAIPSGTLDEISARGAIDRARAALKDTILRGDGRSLGAVRHPHPFFGELTVYQWLELIAGHERRHVEQLREIRDELQRSPLPGATQLA